MRRVAKLPPGSARVLEISLVDNCASPVTLDPIMRIVGHGIDIVETARIERMIVQHGERFLHRCFTEAELRYAGANRRQSEHLAGRFAAKEAIMKVLGTGWTGGIAWTDAEIQREPSGRPRVVLYGACREKAAELGIDQWWISISHICTHAVASAIGVSGGAD